MLKLTHPLRNRCQVRQLAKAWWHLAQRREREVLKPLRIQGSCSVYFNFCHALVDKKIPIPSGPLGHRWMPHFPISPQAAAEPRVGDEHGAPATQLGTEAGGRGRTAPLPMHRGSSPKETQDAQPANHVQRLSGNGQSGVLTCNH